MRRWLVGNKLYVARIAELGIGVASDRLFVAKMRPARDTFFTNRNCRDDVEAAIRPSCSISQIGLLAALRSECHEGPLRAVELSATVY